MHLLELAELLGAEVEVTYFHPTRRFTASLRGMEGGITGTGPSPTAAQRSYTRQIAGKRLAFALDTQGRREYQIPKNLSY
jgi:hypothetical protein